MDKRKDILISALRDNEEGIRRFAAESLEKLEIRERLDLLVKKIETGEMLEKIRALYAFTGLRGEKIAEVLIKASKDPSEDVRAAAVRVLGAMGDANSLAPLVEALKDPSAMVARTAIEALGSYKDPRLLGPFMQALKHTDPGVIERAIEAVGNIGDKRSEEAMIYFAVKGNNKMRQLAIKALGEMDR